MDYTIYRRDWPDSWSDLLWIIPPDLHIQNNPNDGRNYYSLTSIREWLDGNGIDVNLKQHDKIETRLVFQSQEDAAFFTLFWGA